MSSRNPTVSTSTTFSKKVKKPLSVITETAALISEAPDFLRSLNIMRAPPKPAEHTLPSSNKTETEEIIAAMKETLMASPAPTPVILPKKRKRPIYFNLKQLAAKIAKHDHNKILDPKVEEVKDNVEETIPVPVVSKNKGKKLMSEIEVGLIKEDRLRRKRGIPRVPEKISVPSKKAKIETRGKNVKIVESIPVKKTKVQAKKVTKVPLKKTIDENFVSKIQTRNRKKNFIEEILSNDIPSIKEEKLTNNNESSSSFVDLESSQEVTSSEVPPVKKTVKVNPFKPKARNRRKPGVFFGSRKKKRNLKTESKNQQPTSIKDDAIPKSICLDSNSLVSDQTEEQQILQNYDKELEKNTSKIDVTVQKTPQELPKSAQNEPIVITIVEENKVTAPISTDTTELKEPEEVAEPRWHTQSETFFDLSPSISLGSILSSVNQAS